jgi:hypothetical protein
MRVLFLQDRDLVEQAMRTPGVRAVARIDALDCRGRVPRQAVVGTDLAEGVVDVGQSVGRYARHRIAIGGPISVVADDFQGRRGTGGILAGHTRETERNGDQQAHVQG